VRAVCRCLQLREEDAQAEADAKEASVKKAAAHTAEASAKQAAEAKHSANTAVVKKLTSAPLLDTAVFEAVLGHIQVCS
jgi:hypothetical protein